MTTAPHKPTAPTRTPGVLDPQPNAGRPAAPHVPDANELALMAHDTEVAAKSASANQLKRTEPLKGTPDEQIASIQSQMDEMQKHMTALMEANAALARQVRATAQDAPKAVDRPDYTPELLAKARNGELEAPVLTKVGWLVPRVTTANPEQRLDAGTLAAMAAAGAHAQSLKATDKNVVLSRAEQEAKWKAEDEAHTSAKKAA